MAASSSPTTAPWRASFLADVEKMDQPSFTFSTIHTDPSSSSTATPRARTCIFRGLWASLPPNDKNPAPRNPPIYTSDLLTITTDARMEKVPELSSSSSSSPQSGGGGGPVEALFWSVPTKHQWRLRGHAWVFAADDDLDSTSQQQQPRPGKAAVQARMVRSSKGNDDDEDGKAWSWEREITAHFGNLSPAMRGSFKNPAPGTPRATTTPKAGEGLGQTVDNDVLLADEVARRNFRVVVVVPETVELVDLNPEDPRRWLWTFIGAGVTEARTPGGEVKGEWEVVELWP